MTRRRLALICVLAFLLGAMASPGGLALVRSLQGADSIRSAQAHALEVAARIDDQRLAALADLADSAFAGTGHAAFKMVAEASRSYVDSVVTMRAALGLPAGDPMPDWFYACFSSTSTATRSSAQVFDAAGGSPDWTPEQAALVQRTISDLRTISDTVDMVASGGQLVSPTSSVRPGPNGVFSSEAACGQVVTLGDTMSQRQWPG